MQTKMIAVLDVVEYLRQRADQEQKWMDDHPELQPRRLAAARSLRETAALLDEGVTDAERSAYGQLKREGE